MASIKIYTFLTIIICAVFCGGCSKKVSEYQKFSLQEVENYLKTESFIELAEKNDINKETEFKTELIWVGTTKDEDHYLFQYHVLPLSEANEAIVENAPDELMKFTNYYINVVYNVTNKNAEVISFSCGANVDKDNQIQNEKEKETENVKKATSLKENDKSLFYKVEY